MKRIIIFGNSGSGKSTLAKELCRSEKLPHLDLDTLAWETASPPTRNPLNESRQAIETFIAAKPCWIIEGCYSDLLEIAFPYSSEIIFLNLPVEMCIANSRKRAWEPHKYESMEAQNANLNMLVDWIAQYPDRNDSFSKSSHEALFRDYSGKKTMYKSNQRGPDEGAQV